MIEAIVKKLYMQISVMATHIHCKFHEILFFGYLVMAQFIHFKSRAITHALLMPF